LEIVVEPRGMRGWLGRGPSGAASCPVW
jgi:hypothetical protein